MPDDPELLAWVGEDEFHDGGPIGLKQALVAVGRIPLVAVDRATWINQSDVVRQLQAQADRYGKTIRLVRYRPGDTVMTLTPRPQG